MSRELRDGNNLPDYIPSLHLQDPFQCHQCRMLSAGIEAMISEFPRFSIKILDYIYLDDQWLDLVEISKQ
jgi:hypothetical protein